MTKIISQRNARMVGSCTIKCYRTLLCFFKAGLLFLIFSSFFDPYTDEDQNEIKTLFRYLFADNDLGYTLFGEKPMSFCHLSTCAPGISKRDNVFKIYQKGHIPLLTAWKNLSIKSDNFIFITYEKQGIPDLIFLINKRSFHSIFNNNINVFKKAFGDQVTSSSFMTDLENKKIERNELFQNHLALGILLGYGRHNAELFQRREILLNGRCKIPLSSFPNPSSTFHSISEELDFLENILRPIYKGNYSFLLVQPLNFVADPSSQETLQLQAHYKAVQRDLTQLFSQESWFQTILFKLSCP